MGLNASSDEWCRQSDIIIAGLPYAMKIVDDTIIWGNNEAELEERVTTVLQRCADNNITISRKKFELGRKIQFAGHIISDGGIRPDDDKFAALREFKQPENIKELRSFLGLVAQFGAFSPDSACLTSHLRQLLRKDTPWVWLPEHTTDFKQTKEALTCPTTLQPFDPRVKTVLLTDASRLHGIGFALVQRYKDRLALIQCGSASLSPTQSRYSTVELECLAIIHACLLYTSPSPRDRTRSRMPSSA